METEEFEDASVTGLFSRTFDNIHEIYLENGNVLRVSANQPIWTKSKGWTDIEGFDRQKLGANQLEIGDTAYGKTENGELEETKIVDIVPIEGDFFTYDFVDMKYNTFIADDIVVHNSCFMPGTQINLANGSYKNIGEIQIGDMVKVFNEETTTIEQTQASIIQKIIKDDVYEIILENGGTLRQTATHPFQTIENQWVTISGLDGSADYCEILETGDYITQLNQEGDIEYAQVMDIIPIEGVFEMYAFHDGIPIGTQVTLIDGTTKNIEDLEIGDIILSIDLDRKSVV